MITDYDHNNFTVAQALFGENNKANIVPIPWNATTAPGGTKSLGRQATIGIGTGSTIFVLLLATIIFLCVLRRRKRRAMITSPDMSTSSQSPPNARPLSSIPTQELGHRSVAELHDIAHHLELLDGQAPSGSGNEINELPNGDELSRRGTSAPATPHSNPFASRGRSTSPTHSRSNESDSLRGRDEQASVASNPTSDNNGRRTTLTPSHLFIGRTSAQGGARSPSDTQPGVHIDKGLPLLPHQKSHRKQDESLDPSLPDTPISESFQISPAIYAIPGLGGRNLGDVSPKTSPLATYSTIFDIEEYQDSTALIGAKISVS